MLSNISIIIPTYERKDYLNRALEYYKDFSLPIIVCDSSKTKNINIPENVSYFHFPKMGYYDKINKVLDYIQTEYVLYCSDDDFILKQGLEKSYSFLRKNTDYSSVQGACIFYTMYKHKLLYAPFQLNSIGLDINKSTPLERLKQFALPAPVFLDYALHKTESLKKTFKTIHEMGTNLYEIGGFYHQLIPIINGKHKVLEEMFIFREWHHLSSGYKMKSLYEIIQNKNIHNTFLFSQKILSKYISKEFNEDMKDCERTIKNIFNNYLNSNEIQRDKNLLKKSITKTIKKKQTIYYTIENNLFPNKKNNDSLKKMESIILKYIGIYNTYEKEEKNQESLPHI